MISDNQRKVLAFPFSSYDTLICEGAIRSGKTSLMMVSFVDWAMRTFDRQSLIVMGKSVGSVERNVIDPYRSMADTRRRYATSYNKGERVMTVRSGERENRFHVFGAPNSRSFETVQGFTAAGALIDEVPLCDRKAFDQALGRCSVHGSRYFLSCNPDSPRHWFYRDWVLGAERQNALVLHFEMDDNPSLSEETKERLRRQYSGVFYRRYIKGLWVVAEGLVYQYDQADVTCQPEEAEAEGGAWYLSVDYGIVNPFVALLWRVTPRCAYLVDEYYFDSRKEGRRKTDAEHMDAVEALAGGRPIEAMVVDPSASSFKEEAYRRGRLGVMDGDNDVVPGITTTDLMLSRGSIRISTRCAETLAEMGLYRWDDKAARDQVVKEDDHAMDAMRYMAYTVLRYELAGYA